MQEHSLTGAQSYRSSVLQSTRWGEDPENLDPLNLPEDARTTAMYQGLVQADLAQPVVVESAAYAPPSSLAQHTGDAARSTSL
jgi:hypothetical protein